MWRSFANFESREGDLLVARHYFARAVNAEVQLRTLSHMHNPRHLLSLTHTSQTPVHTT